MDVIQDRSVELVTTQARNYYVPCQMPTKFSKKMLGLVNNVQSVLFK